MAYWLLKTEPSEYAWDDLAHDRSTRWNGIRNPTALLHLRAIRKGDQLLIYHTGSERKVVGLARAAADAIDDDDGPGVDIKADDAMPDAVSLAMLREQPALADWDLFRLGRLSVVPVTKKQFDAVLKLAGFKPVRSGAKR